MHTPKGGQILGNFLTICGVARLTAEHIIDELVSDVQQQVGDGRVLLAISGGVGTAPRCTAAGAGGGGFRLTAVFIDHGLLRLGEREQVEAALVRQRCIW